MKGLRLITILGALLLMYGCGQMSEIKKEEKKLIEGEKWETSDRIQVKFLSLLQKNPSSIDYDFPLLCNNKNVIFSKILSKDHNLCIYQLDIGGRNCNYISWYQYRSNGKVFSGEGDINDIDENGIYKNSDFEGVMNYCSASEIYSTDFYSNIYYIIVNKCQRDNITESGHIWTSIFIIDENKLKRVDN